MLNTDRLMNAVVLDRLTVWEPRERLTVAGREEVGFHDRI